MKRKTIFFGAIIAAAVVAGASLFYFLYLGNPSRQALARVNEEKITVKEFNQELAKLEDPLRQMYREEPLPFLEGMIVKKLLLQEAKKQGLSSSPKTYKDVTKDSLPPEEMLIAELMKKKFGSPPEVTRKEVESFYSLFKDQMKGKTLNEVAPFIEQMIREGKQRQQVEQFVRELQSSAKIEIEQGRLRRIAVKPPESNSEEDFKKAIGSGKPVVVDFGANSCIPCRQMRPILKEVERDYSGKTHVLVIDVYKHQDLAREYKIQLIPTLIFFDSKGKEAFRHVGVMNKEKIAAKLKEIGMAL
ncbi:MAG: thioredoxin fold domain-containing protein [Syntrophaceae bacterium]|nr:thioredoxin fold domain-containing protein [Syntrophaceae bacterium]